VPHVDVLVTDALRPGKLLRPELVVHSARVASGVAGAASAPGADLEERVVAGAVAVELLHVATLVHDDIIDEAPLRRGRPSVVAAAGTPTAIVVGDLLLARGATAAASASADAAAAWALALERMASGQLREELLAAAPSVEAHAEYVALKTAALFRASAEIGALVAGARPDVVEALGSFGHHFGMAFQHVDDLLDTIGDPRLMGKPVDADGANGVPTAVALAGPDGATAVGSELAAARAALPAGDADLAGWAERSLRRTLRAALGEEGWERSRHLLAAIDGPTDGPAEPHDVPAGTA
jgi:geranylgeranyl pyrophosphate synthase